MQVRDGDIVIIDRKTMPDTTSLALFLIAALTLNVTPGPDMLYVILSGSIGDWLTSRPRFSQIQQWFTGSVFVALGTSIALPERK